MSIRQIAIIIIIAILNGSESTEEQFVRESTAEQFVRISPQHPNTATTFLPAHHPNYFRHAGVVTGVSAYAHISLTVDFEKLEETIEYRCRCAHNVRAEVEKNDHLKGNTKKLLKQRTELINRRCEALKTEVNYLRESFQEVDTEINLHKESYANMQDRLRHGKSFNWTTEEEYQLVDREERAAIAAAAISVIGGAIGAIGGYSLASIFGQEYDDSDIWEQIDLTELEIQGIKEDMEWVQESLSSLNDDMEYVQRKLKESDWKDYQRERTEVQIGKVDVCEAALSSLATEIRSVLNGIDSLLNGKLGVGMIRPEVLKAKLEAIDAAANRRRQNVAVRSIHEIYKLPISILSTTSGQVTFAIHVPLFEIRNQLALWEYIAMPTYIEKNSTVGGGAAYMFKPEHDFLAINNDLYFQEMTKADLNECRKVEGTYVCETTVLSRELKQSCITGLFRANEKTMEDECDVEIIAEGQNIIKQVGPHDFAGYFGTPTVVQVSCETYVTGRANSKELLGSYRITIPGGCTGSTATHRFSPIEDLGRFHSLVYVPMKFEITHALEEMDEPEIERVSRQLRTHQRSRVSLHQLRSAIRKPFAWIWNYPKQLLGYLGTIGSILIVVICVGPIFYCFCVKRRFKMLEQLVPDTRVRFMTDDMEMTERPRRRMPSTSSAKSILQLPAAISGSNPTIPRVTDEYVAAMLRPNNHL